ncbi:MAG TPA: hypothetical protein VFE78_23525 [Gemmataceae bacterium]|jgi:hypothetical protein|nr:hypothetical protein [Gemmataceae bacterium]
MKAHARRWSLALLVAAACAGCDPATTAYFLLPETKDPPELRRLSSDDKKKEVKVAILTHTQLETRPELIQADRQLAESLAKQLRERFAENREKVVVVSPRRVEEYKNSHPRWRDPLEVGRELRVDYVIYLEINSMSLYEKGSSNLMYRGRTNISVSLVDVNRPDENPEQTEITTEYPSEARGPVDASLDTNPMQFRAAFLGYVAKRVSWCFTGHRKRDTSIVE